MFITAGLVTWASGYDRGHPHFRVVTADRVVEDGYFTIVLNTNPYTYLGNRPARPVAGGDARPGLVVVTFRTMRATAILRSLAGALRGGGVEPTDDLDEQIDLDHVVVEHERPFPYQLDGDYLGETTRLEFHHVPDAVRLVFPWPPAATGSAGEDASVTSGTSVQMPSMPHDASSANRPGRCTSRC